MTIYDLVVTAVDAETGESGSLVVQFPVNEPVTRVPPFASKGPKDPFWYHWFHHNDER